MLKKNSVCNDFPIGNYFKILLNKRNMNQNIYYKVVMAYTFPKHSQRDSIKYLQYFYQINSFSNILSISLTFQ